MDFNTSWLILAVARIAHTIKGWAVELIW